MIADADPGDEDTRRAYLPPYEMRSLSAELEALEDVSAVPHMTLLDAAAHRPPSVRVARAVERLIYRLVATS